MPTEDAEPARLRAGKLPASLLRGLLAGVPRNDRRVLLGPGVGEDAALISFGATTLVAKSDPITFASDLIGWYAVQVNANDIAASGGEPKWFLATVLLPEGESPDAARRILEQLTEATQAIGVTLVGGHTEVTIGLPRPIVCGTMLGETTPSAALPTSGVLPGDRIILTQGIAVEGTALLAREAGGRLRDSGVPTKVIDRAAEFLFDPGISVLPAARAVRGLPGVSAMHDPTEGGLATALAEMAEASRVGLEIDAAAVHVFPETRSICDALGVDPWGLIASGALLVAVRPEGAERLTRTLQKAGVPASEIAVATSPETGLYITSSVPLRPLPTFGRDELARILET